MTQVPELIDLSAALISIIKRNLVFSFVYNAAGATLALLEFINPLAGPISP